MKYGYARVSSIGQNLDAQLKQLEDYGCEVVYREKISGREKENRHEFNKLLERAKIGDTIVVTKLDRFARSTKDALSTIEILNESEVNLVVLNMGGDRLDTSTPIGKLMITVLSGIAEFEVDMIKERQLEGIELAKERGVYKGRPKRYTENHKGLQHAVKLFINRDENKLTVNEISEITNVSRATIYRAVKENIEFKA
ncbi:recombinase family protein [Sporosarcina sp. G11-34]|uniref:recombinase family protein n=1 Tax=Sporosarcina sp. G11-34 TaxID=2849605 RepID=UPI0022A9BDEC|nr:recombinase family protein [Sporosarcina sp. G11-34]MCZ2259853.1 recombinase family protein [Sporosarcina sp. G11-34]